MLAIKEINELNVLLPELLNIIMSYIVRLGKKQIQKIETTCFKCASFTMLLPVDDSLFLDYYCLSKCCYRTLACKKCNCIMTILALLEFQSRDPTVQIAIQDMLLSNSDRKLKSLFDEKKTIMH